MAGPISSIIKGVRIIINEPALRSRIKKLEDIKKVLDSAANNLDPAKHLDDTRMLGKMRDALGEKLKEACVDLKNLGIGCEATGAWINEIIKAYKETDHSLSDLLNG